MCSNREAESLTNPQDDLFGLLELISRGEVQAGRALRRGVEQHIRSDLVSCHGTKILGKPRPIATPVAFSPTTKTCKNR